MASDDETNAELPRLLAGRYRPRWRAPVPGAAPEARASLVARDTLLGRDLDLTRVALGAGRAAERDAQVAALRARTTVLSPALVAIHDAGEWQEDLFVATEAVEGSTPLEVALAATEAPSLAERLRWGLALAEAALAVDEVGLALEPGAWDETVIDAHRVPRVRGLDRAIERTEAARQATVAALGRLLARLVPEGGAEVAVAAPLQAVADDAAEGRLTLEELRARLAALSGAPERARPLLAHIDADALARREARVLVLGLALFVMAFVVLVLALAALR